MISLEYLHRVVIPAAYQLLPSKLASDKATAMLLAIALQESRVEYRRQMGNGPARGFFQFEAAGVAGVLTHPASSPLILPLCDVLVYPALAYPIHMALEHNDILAAVFARLLLWTLPAALPEAHEVPLAWGQYLAAWRPGKPHPQTWASNYMDAWALVAKGERT